MHLSEKPGGSQKQQQTSDSHDGGRGQYTRLPGDGSGSLGQTNSLPERGPARVQGEPVFVKAPGKRRASGGQYADPCHVIITQGPGFISYYVLTF